MSSTLHVAVTEPDRTLREGLVELLSRLGHQVVGVDGIGQLSELCRVSAPDLLILDAGAVDGSLGAIVSDGGRQLPIVLLDDGSNPGLLARAAARRSVMALLSKPPQPADIEAGVVLATTRYAEIEALRAESEGLRQALEERKLVERAKGVVMRRLRLDEPTAHRRLRQLANDQHRKLVDVARKVVEAEAALALLDRS
jgi:AmiR/NasT family two-component response regulator